MAGDDADTPQRLTPRAASTLAHATQLQSIGGEDRPPDSFEIASVVRWFLAGRGLAAHDADEFCADAELVLAFSFAADDGVEDGGGLAIFAREADDELVAGLEGLLEDDADALC